MYFVNVVYKTLSISFTAIMVQLFGEGLGF